LVDGRLDRGLASVMEILGWPHGGDAVTAWEAMGRPESPMLEQTEELQADKDGQLHVRLSMPAWAWC